MPSEKGGAPIDDSRGQDTKQITSAIMVPKALLYGLLVTIPSTIGAGAWYMSGQASEIRNDAEIVSKQTTEITGMRGKIDGVDARLIRIEAQLAFVAAQVSTTGIKK